MFERYTDGARQVVVLSGEEAKRLGHDYIGTEHILLALRREGTGVAAKALQALSVELDATRAQVEQITRRGMLVPPTGHIPLTPRARTVLELASREAQDLSHDYIGTEHILLALRREGEDAGAQVLRRSGVEFADVRQQIRQLMRRSLPLYSLGRTPHSRRLSPRCQRVPTSAKPAALSASTWVASWLDSVPWWPAST